MTILVADIETIPLISDEIRAEVEASIKPPGTYKKEETIAAWLANDKPALVEAELARGGLDATRGQVLCFTYAINDDAPICITGDELSILGAALEVMIYNPINLYVMHNGLDFDLPFIKQRCWVNGLKVPAKPFKVKPWDDCVFDTMLAWSADRTKRISLDKLCRVLGVESPKANGMDGSQVWPMYQQGRIEDIRSYAIADVVATRAVYNRMK